MCVTCGCTPAPLGLRNTDAAPDITTRVIDIERSLLADNDEQAQRNRAWFNDHAITAFNLLSSPGSGKTTLLIATINALNARTSIAVIEGDQQTDRDAQRIRATGAPAVQINTGKGCHLDARMVQHGLDQLQPQRHSILFIENVGNLVCPADFDLGEHAKVVVLSVTEGDDKPLKYPNMFHAADLVVLNKIDLLPHVTFDVAQCRQHIARINPRVQMIEVSATRGDGMGEWCGWIEGVSGKKKSD